MLKTEEFLEPEQAFTVEQLNKWKAYERVRVGGRYNMFDPRAPSH